MEEAAKILPKYPADLDVLGWVIVVLVLAYFVDVVWIRPRALKRTEDVRSVDRREERTAFIEALSDVTTAHREEMSRFHERLDKHEREIAQTVNGLGSTVNSLGLKLDSIQSSIHNLPVYRSTRPTRGGTAYGGLEIIAPEPQPSNEPKETTP